MHMIPPAVVDGAIRNPLTMIASDGLLQKGKGHPRGSGSYARVLGYYVRETGTLSLMSGDRENVADARAAAGKVCARHEGQGTHPGRRRCRPGGFRCRARARPVDIRERGAVF